VADAAECYVFRLLEPGYSIASLSDDARPMVFHAPAQPRPPGSQASAEESSTAAAITAAVAAEDVGGEPRASPLPGVLGRSSACSGAAVTQDDPDKIVVVYLIHRRMRKVQNYFLDPYKCDLFGTPALIRVRPSCPAAELYAVAFRQIRHFVPDYAPTDGQWPFTLSSVKRDGSTCATCSWRRGCQGCSILAAPDAPPVCLREESTLAIDWDAEVLEKYYKAKIAAHVHVHESVELAQIERNTPERLSQCLDGLVKEEELTSYCRECTKKAGGEFTESAHTKAFRIWACGPLLVLQLKRFHSKDGYSYKLCNLVTFPTELNLQDYLAEATATTGSSIVSGAPEGDVGGAGSSPEGGPGASDGGGGSSGGGGGQTAARESCASFSTLSRDVVKYQLYGVVNHMGGMGSGHYTAFVRRGSQTSGRTRWFCCDDDRVYAVAEEDVVTANAYLLFYARADVASGELTLNDVFPPRPSTTSPTALPDEVKRRPWHRSKEGSSDAPARGSSGGSGGGACTTM